MELEISLDSSENDTSGSDLDRVGSRQLRSRKSVVGGCVVNHESTPSKKKKVDSSRNQTVEEIYKQLFAVKAKSTALETIYEQPKNFKDSQKNVMGSVRTRRMCLMDNFYNPSKFKIKGRKERAKRLKRLGVKVPTGDSITVEDVQAVLNNISDDEEVLNCSKTENILVNTSLVCVTPKSDIVLPSADVPLFAATDFIRPDDSYSEESRNSPNKNITMEELYNMSLSLFDDSAQSEGVSKSRTRKGRRSGGVHDFLSSALTYRKAAGKDQRSDECTMSHIPSFRKRVNMIAEEQVPDDLHKIEVSACEISDSNVSNRRKSKNIELPTSPVAVTLDYDSSETSKTSLTSPHKPSSNLVDISCNSASSTVLHAQSSKDFGPNFHNSKLTSKSIVCAISHPQKVSPPASKNVNPSSAYASPQSSIKWVRRTRQSTLRRMASPPLPCPVCEDCSSWNSRQKKSSNYHTCINSNSICNDKKNCFTKNTTKKRRVSGVTKTLYSSYLVSHSSPEEVSGLAEDMSIDVSKSHDEFNKNVGAIADICLQASKIDLEKNVKNSHCDVENVLGGYSDSDAVGPRVLRKRKFVEEPEVTPLTTQLSKLEVTENVKLHTGIDGGQTHGSMLDSENTVVKSNNSENTTPNECFSPAMLMSKLSIATQSSVGKNIKFIESGKNARRRSTRLQISAMSSKSEIRSIKYEEKQPITNAVEISSLTGNDIETSNVDNFQQTGSMENRNSMSLINNAHPTHNVKDPSIDGNSNKSNNSQDEEAEVGLINFSNGPEVAVTASLMARTRSKLPITSLVSSLTGKMDNTSKVALKTAERAGGGTTVLDGGVVRSISNGTKPSGSNVVNGKKLLKSNSLKQKNTKTSITHTKSNNLPISYSGLLTENLHNFDSNSDCIMQEAKNLKTVINPVFTDASSLQSKECNIIVPVSSSGVAFPTVPLTPITVVKCIQSLPPTNDQTLNVLKALVDTSVNKSEGLNCVLQTKVSVAATRISEPSATTVMTVNPVVAVPTKLPSSAEMKKTFSMINKCKPRHSLTSHPCFSSDYAYAVKSSGSSIKKFKVGENSIITKNGKSKQKRMSAIVASRTCFQVHPALASHESDIFAGKKITFVPEKKPDGDNSSAAQAFVSAVSQKLADVTLKNNDTGMTSVSPREIRELVSGSSPKLSRSPFGGKGKTKVMLNDLADQEAIFDSPSPKLERKDYLRLNLDSAGNPFSPNSTLSLKPFNSFSPPTLLKSAVPSQSPSPFMAQEPTHTITEQLNVVPSACRVSPCLSRTETLASCVTSSVTNFHIESKINKPSDGVAVLLPLGVDDATSGLSTPSSSSGESIPTSQEPAGTSTETHECEMNSIIDKHVPVSSSNSNSSSVLNLNNDSPLVSGMFNNKVGVRVGKLFTNQSSKFKNEKQKNLLINFKVYPH